MNILISQLPNELIKHIFSYFNTRTFSALSLVDRRLHAVVLNTINCIGICPPSNSNIRDYPPDLPENILVTVIQRYPNLKEITFGLLKNPGIGGEFSAQEVPYLKSLISCLENKNNEHPLHAVKKIHYQEILQDNVGDFGKDKAKEINCLFLKSLGHKGLENLRVKALNRWYHRSILTGAEIQPILDQSPNLRTFVFDGLQSYEQVNLSFESQPELVKVKFLEWKGNPSTLESLKNCKKLKELVIDFERTSSLNIQAILSEDHPWDLKLLQLKCIAPRDDDELKAITKKLPNLETLSVNLHDISDDGMDMLGKNCSKLKVLAFSNKNLSNFGLAKLTQHLSDLEIICFDNAYNITEEGIAALARYCKNLRLIQVMHYKHIAKSGIDALIHNCPYLRGVEFSYGGPISFEDIYHLVEKIPGLRRVRFESIKGIEESQIKSIYTTFPHLRSIPYLSSVKKLQKL